MHDQPTHPLLPDDQRAAELSDTMQCGYDLLEDVVFRLQRLLDAWDGDRVGPGLRITLEDIGRTYSLLDDLRVQHAQTGGQIDKLSEHLSLLNVMRLGLEKQLRLAG